MINVHKNLEILLEAIFSIFIFTFSRQFTDTFASFINLQYQEASKTLSTLPLSFFNRWLAIHISPVVEINENLHILGSLRLLI